MSVAKFLAPAWFLTLCPDLVVMYPLIGNPYKHRSHTCSCLSGYPTNSVRKLYTWMCDGTGYLQPYMFSAPEAITALVISVKVLGLTPVGGIALSPGASHSRVQVFSGWCAETFRLPQHFAQIC